MGTEEIKFDVNQAIEGLSGIGGMSEELKTQIENETKTTVAEEKPIENVDVAKEDKVEVDADDISKTLFGNTLANSEEIEVTDLRGLAEAITKDGLFTLKDETELPKFLDSYKELSDKVQGFEKIEKEYQGYEALFQNMPDYLFEAIHVWTKNGDPIEVLKNKILEPFDYNIPFEKQDIVKLINHYYPNQFTQDEFEEDDNKALKIAKEEVKRKFSDEAKNYKPIKSQIEENTRLQEQAIKESATKVMTKFEANTEVPTIYKKEVSKILNSGYNSLLTKLVNEKGEWKEESAEMINFLLHGKEMLTKAKEIIKKQAINKLNENHVALGHDKPSVKTGSTSNVDIKTLEKQAQNYVDSLFK